MLARHWRANALGTVDARKTSTMTNSRASGLLVVLLGLTLVSSCGSGSSSSQQVSELRHDDEIQFCCRAEFPPGQQRHQCVLDAQGGDGICATCSTLRAPCDAGHPCCSDFVCSSGGVCVQRPPACMPDGALCSSVSPCCSRAGCVNGFCGGACVLDGVACDPDRVCCSSGSTCKNNEGVCGGVVCRALGQSCGGPGGLECCSGSLCAGLCRTQGGSCSDVGIICNAVPNGCCSGSTCVGGTCAVAVGCYPPGQDCLLDHECCSGICSLNLPSSRGNCL